MISIYQIHVLGITLCQKKGCKWEDSHIYNYMTNEGFFSEAFPNSISIFYFWMNTGKYIF